MRTPLRSLVDLRQIVGVDLEQACTGLLLDPDVTVDGPALEALGKTLQAYEALVLATTTSSSPSYAFRDLNANESAKYKRAKHALRLLLDTHGPKVQPS